MSKENRVTLKTKKEIIADKREELNQIISELFQLEADFKRKKNELEEKARKLSREIMKGERRA